MSNEIMLINILDDVLAVEHMPKFIECCLYSTIPSNDANLLFNILNGLCESRTNVTVHEQLWRQAQTQADDGNLTKKYVSGKDFWMRTYTPSESTTDKIYILRSCEPCKIQQSENMPCALRNISEELVTLQKVSELEAENFTPLHQFWRVSDVFQYRFGFPQHVTINVSRFYNDRNLSEECFHEISLIELIAKVDTEVDNAVTVAHHLKHFATALEPEVKFVSADLFMTKHEYESIKKHVDEPQTTSSLSVLNVTANVATMAYSVAQNAALSGSVGYGHRPTALASHSTSHLLPGSNPSMQAQMLAMQMAASVGTQGPYGVSSFGGMGGVHLPTGQQAPGSSHVSGGQAAHPIHNVHPQHHMMNNWGRK